jgi:ABC-type nitrate/sulfonate/bicarbonate transport system ATPase subunit
VPLESDIKDAGKTGEPGPARPPKLSLRGVSKRFETRRGTVRAVDETDLDVEEGEFLTIVGPSGCGKSTMLMIASGLETPSAGTIVVDGKPAGRPGPDRSVVFQQFALFPHMNVARNIEYGLKVAGAKKSERHAAVEQQVAIMGLEGFQKAYPSELSGGMQQRVAIARALAYNPSVLLMDEPFAALDALTRDDMQRLLADVWRETRKTVVYVTHNVAEAVYLADRVVVMTPHPGMVKTEVPIRLPRPRDPLSVEFLDYQKSLLRHLGQDAMANDAKD